MLLLLLNLQSAPAAPRQSARQATGAGQGGGPGAQLSLSDYLKKFGNAHTPPAAAMAPGPAPARLAALARKKRQRMEEEVLALAVF